MQLEELPEIRNDDRLVLTLLEGHNAGHLLDRCAPGGVYRARRITSVQGENAQAVTRMFGMQQDGRIPVVEVYLPINLLITSVVTRFSTTYIPVERISSCHNLSRKY